MDFLLSICIPTYNRSVQLKKTLDSIVEEPIFLSKKIEVIVSDNVSTDDTADMMQDYCNKFENIKYSRNLSNNGFMNIISVLGLARGKLCKVVNDYLVLNKGTLNRLVTLAEEHNAEDTFFFFANGFVKGKKDTQVDSFDKFIDKISYWCTFVGGFCIWKKDFDLLKDCEINKMFPHTSLLFQMVSKKKYIIIHGVFFENQKVEKKGGYDLFNVFAVQFLNMLSSLKDNSLISPITFKHIKRDLFYNFLVMWYYKLLFDKDNAFSFEFKNIKKDIQTYYSYWDYIKLCVLGRMYFINDLKGKVKIFMKQNKK